MEVGDPYLYPGEGSSVQLVKFRLVVFKPFIGEILTAKISSSSKDGIKLSLGFFDDITIPGALLQHPSEYTSNGLWKWTYEEAGVEFYYKIGEEVR